MLPPIFPRPTNPSFVDPLAAISGPPHSSLAHRSPPVRSHQAPRASHQMGARASCLALTSSLLLHFQGLPFLRRRAILGHRGLHERLERARVDLLPFVDVDRSSRVAFQAGIEEVRWVWDPGPPD